MEDGEPDHALRLLLHPVEEVERLYELVIAGGLEAGPHTRLHVGPAERLGLTQHAGNLHRGEVKLGLLLVNFICIFYVEDGKSASHLNAVAEQES